MEREFFIRRAGPKDVDELTSLLLEFNAAMAKLNPVFKELAGDGTEHFREQALKGIDDRGGEFVLVADAGGKIAGLVFCETKKRPNAFKVKSIGHISELFVLPKFRKKGIAKALVKEAEKEFRKRKLKHIFLKANSNNPNALKTYQALGFKEYKKEMTKKL